MPDGYWQNDEVKVGHYREEPQPLGTPRKIRCTETQDNFGENVTRDINYNIGVMPRPDVDRLSLGMSSHHEPAIQTPMKNLAGIDSPFFDKMSLAEIAQSRTTAFSKTIINGRILTMGNGATFEGEVVDSRPHGRGVYRLTDSDIYIGFFRGNKAIYKVEHFSINNQTHYTGLLNDAFLYHGYGTLIKYPGKQRFSGEFKNGLPNGDGQETEANDTGLTFIGTFKDGLRVKGMIVRSSDGAVVAMVNRLRRRPIN